MPGDERTAAQLPSLAGLTMVPIPRGSWAQVTILLLFGMGCASQRPPWTAQEILREVEPELQRFDGVNQPIVEAHILMWQIEEDPDRKFVVEEALLWTRSDSPRQGKSWAPERLVYRDQERSVGPAHATRVSSVQDATQCHRCVRVSTARSRLGS